MPAAVSRSTVFEVSVASRLASIREPPVPMRPAMSHKSQAIKPCSGPSGSPALEVSAASASTRLPWRKLGEGMQLGVRFGDTSEQGIDDLAGGRLRGEFDESSVSVSSWRAISTGRIEA